LYGARISVLLGVVVVALASAIGIPAGLVAGYYRGALDWVLSRLMDALFAFPVILLALALVAVLGSDTRNLVLALTIVFVPGSTRLTRAATLATSRQEYIEAARSSGASNARIMFRHVVPNILAVVFVQLTLILAFAMLVEASLSFLGLGIQPPAASWGSMLNSNKASLEEAPWASILPGLCIMFAVLGFNLLGDSLRDTLDPSIRR
jgi:peptide/nickel transport system permease protein